MLDNSTAPSPESLPVLRGQGPAWYAQEMFRVIKLDVEAMGRVAKDPAALGYAVVVKVLTVVVRLLAGLALAGPPAAGFAGALVAGTAMVLAADIVGLLLVHGAAKVIFGATGSFLGLIRVLWLGSLIGCLAIVPVVGGIVAGIWGLLMMMVAFQEVDGIERLQALALSFGVSAVVYLVVAFLT